VIAMQQHMNKVHGHMYGDKPYRRLTMQGGPETGHLAVDSDVLAGAKEIIALHEREHAQEPPWIRPHDHAA